LSAAPKTVLALFLLMLRIFANNHYSTFSLNDLAFLTHRLN
jgi:hypothetical protein